MIDDVEATVRPTPPKRPHRRTKPLAAPTHPNGMPDQLAAMQARIDALERQQVGHFVESRPEPAPVPRLVPDEALTPFQREVQARTHTVPRDYVRNDPGYNYAVAWYARPDGDIVQLQGDPNNRAMYVDLGFHLLTPDEVERWENGERAKVVARQKEKASLVRAIR